MKSSYARVIKLNNIHCIVSGSCLSTMHAYEYMHNRHTGVTLKNLYIGIKESDDA